MSKLNKNTRSTSLTLLRYVYVVVYIKHGTHFTSFCSVFIVDFEHTLVLEVDFI